MTSRPAAWLVILAGGQSSRMGSDKAVIPFEEERLVDRLIGRFATQADRIVLSARDDYGTGLECISDDPGMPGGPVGAIFTLAARLGDRQAGIEGFVTVPVDAPFAPVDLIERLSTGGTCAVARDHQRIHPTFAYWRCDIISRIRATHDGGEKAPSLHWLAEQSGAEAVVWPDAKLFLNINRPEDLIKAEQDKTAGA